MAVSDSPLLSPDVPLWQRWVNLRTWLAAPDGDIDFSGANATGLSIALSGLPTGAAPNDIMYFDGLAWQLGSVTAAGAAGAVHSHNESEILDGSILARVADNETITGDWDFDGNLTYDKLTGPTDDTRDKIRVWNNSIYTIGMANGFTFGALSNDYAMTFQMNDSANRGFWWGDDQQTGAQGAMSLTTDGRATIATSLSIGHGEAHTSAPICELEVHQPDTSGGLVSRWTDAGGRQMDIFAPNSANIDDPWLWSTPNSYEWTVDGSRALTIASNGRVGVGSFSSQSDVLQQFHVLGGAQVEGDGGNALLTIAAPSGFNPFLILNGDDSSEQCALFFDTSNNFFSLHRRSSSYPAGGIGSFQAAPVQFDLDAPGSSLVVNSNGMTTLQGTDVYVLEAYKTSAIGAADNDLTRIANFEAEMDPNQRILEIWAQRNAAKGAASWYDTSIVLKHRVDSVDLGGIHFGVKQATNTGYMVLEQGQHDVTIDDDGGISGGLFRAPQWPVISFFYGDSSDTSDVASTSYTALNIFGNSLNYSPVTPITYSTGEFDCGTDAADYFVQVVVPFICAGGTSRYSVSMRMEYEINNSGSWASLGQYGMFSRGYSRTAGNGHGCMTMQGVIARGAIGGVGNTVKLRVVAKTDAGGTSGTIRYGGEGASAIFQQIYTGQ